MIVCRMVPLCHIFRHSFLICCLYSVGISHSKAEILTNFRSKPLILHAQGQQIYTCLPLITGGLKWTLTEPAAELFYEGEYVGVHIRGPRWTLSDGSSIYARLISTKNSANPDNISQLHMKSVPEHRRGTFREVQYVDRINTVGGMLSGKCAKKNLILGIPYQADYKFTYK